MNILAWISSLFIRIGLAVYKLFTMSYALVISVSYFALVVCYTSSVYYNSQLFEKGNSLFGV